MTPKQLKLLSFIDDYQIRHGGITPTYTEMMEHLGIRSKNTVFQTLDLLEREGRIKRPNVKGAARGITVLIPPHRAKIVCPHCGGSFTPT